MSEEQPDREERIRRIEQARQHYDVATAAYAEARKELITEIRGGLTEGIGPSALARHSGFTREYVGRIRDGKVSDNPVSSQQ
ncbi:hypothetical protein [Nocardia noduli]|uniref:hypothetical protein n=1 Tax=Nocardia noduli TaxID=2815722 RepID=UPI0020B24274|nr:hypothetical protein [Nocardia noduli]